MTTIRPNTKPPLWWLFPWSYARTLHMNAALLDDMLDLQHTIIEDQAADIRLLRQRVRDQNDAIIRGKAITPDAHPYTE